MLLSYEKNKTLQKTAIFLLLIGLLILVGYFLNNNLGLRYNPKEVHRQYVSVNDNYDYNNILVIRAVDGDTLFLENRKYVRLLGLIHRRCMNQLSFIVMPSVLSRVLR